MLTCIKIIYLAWALVDNEKKLKSDIHIFKTGTLKIKSEQFEVQIPFLVDGCVSKQSKNINNLIKFAHLRTSIFFICWQLAANIHSTMIKLTKYKVQKLH